MKSLKLALCAVLLFMGSAANSQPFLQYAYQRPAQNGQVPAIYPKAVETTLDGGSVVAGSTENPNLLNRSAIYVTKLAKDGSTVLISKMYWAEEPCYAHDIKEVIENGRSAGFIVVGFTNTQNAGNRALVMRLNPDLSIAPNGVKIIQDSDPATDEQSIALSIERLSGTGAPANFVVTGYMDRWISGNSPRYGILLMYLDNSANGTIKKIDDPGAHSITGWDVTEITQNGAHNGVALTGEVVPLPLGGNQKQLFVASVNAAGTAVNWMKKSASVTEVYGVRGRAIKFNPANNHLIATGESNDKGFVWEYNNSTGTTIASSLFTFTGASYSQGSSISLHKNTLSSNYVIGGTYIQSGDANAYLLSGNMNVAKGFGGTGTDEGTAMTAIDGGVAFVGITDSPTFGVAGVSQYIVREPKKANGNFEGCGVTIHPRTAGSLEFSNMPGQVIIPLSTFLGISLFVTDIGFQQKNASMCCSLDENYVLNPGFDQRSSTPPHWSGPTNMRADDKVLLHCNWWKRASAGTPDYFTPGSEQGCHPASYPSEWAVGEPHNFMGSQYGRGGITNIGSSYVGLENWSPAYDEMYGYREYVEGTLKQPLQAGKTYSVSFYINLAGNSNRALNRAVSAAFTSLDNYAVNAAPYENNPGDYNNEHGYFFNNALYNNAPLTPCLPTWDLNLMTLTGIQSYRCDTTNWMRITGTYTPQQTGDQYIILGYFDCGFPGPGGIDGIYTSMAPCNTTSPLNCYIGAGTPTPGIAYYYIDDVEVRCTGMAGSKEAEEYNPSGAGDEDIDIEVLNTTARITAKQGIHNVRLQICNMLGQEVSILDIGNLPAGEYSYDLDIFSLESGAYLVRVLSGNHHLDTEKVYIME